MFIAHISDNHLNHYPEVVRSILHPDINQKFDGLRSVGFPDHLDADILILAGDIHPNAGVRGMLVTVLEKQYGIPVLMVCGNHDFEDRSFNSSDQITRHLTYKGVTFGLAPLWTELSPLDQMRANGFHDFKYIEDTTIARWNTIHKEQLASLIAARPDVIVTHHAPFVQSLHADYTDDPFNMFFVNTRIDPGWFPNTRLWLHGHVHSSFDYMIDNLHVVCNPKGYPFEKRLGIKVEITEV